MKIEVGKYYRTRDGQKVGPMFPAGQDYDEGVITDGDLTWFGNGEFGIPNSRHDLIAEWIDEPAEAAPILSGETIDHIAIDSLKWHFKDKDMEPLQYEAFRVVLRYYGVSV